MPEWKLADDSGLEYTLRGLFFPERATRDHSYHTNKTRLAEAPFGPVGDDNGPGSEPPPHDRLR
ncbi:hypothetical protein THAOC_21234, partial [Thalassiosira oceanica]